MSNDKTGGPAFPFEHKYDDGRDISTGMTLWDRYAEIALDRMLGNNEDRHEAVRRAGVNGTTTVAEIARCAANVADAMMEERKKRGIA